MKSTDQASESSKVGIAPRFQSALELCGRTDQDGMSVAHYGYLAHIHGLPLDELFPTGRQSVRHELRRPRKSLFYRRSSRR